MEDSLTIICNPETEQSEGFQNAREIAEMLWDLADSVLINRIYIPLPVPQKNTVLNNISYLGFEESEEFWNPDFGRIFTKKEGGQKLAIGLSHGQSRPKLYIDCAELLEQAKAKFIFLVFRKNHKVAWNRKMTTQFLFKTISKESKIKLYGEIVDGMEKIFEENKNGETEAVFVIGVE